MPFAVLRVILGLLVALVHAQTCVNDVSHLAPAEEKGLAKPSGTPKEAFSELLRLRGIEDRDGRLAGELETALELAKGCPPFPRSLSRERPALRFQMTGDWAHREVEKAVVTTPEELVDYLYRKHSLDSVDVLDAILALKRNMAFWKLVSDPNRTLYRYAAATAHRWGGTLWDKSMVYQNMADLADYPHSFWSTQKLEGYANRDGQSRPLLTTTVGELEKNGVLGLDVYERDSIIFADTKHGKPE